MTMTKPGGTAGFGGFGAFSGGGGFGGAAKTSFGTTAGQEAKLTAEQKNQPLQFHLDLFKRTMEEQREEYDSYAKQVYGQDQKNYLANQELGRALAELDQLETRQVQQGQNLSGVASRQQQLFKRMQEIPVGQENTGELIALMQEIMAVKQWLELFNDTGLAQMKKINEVHQFLASACDQLKIQ